MNVYNFTNKDEQLEVLTKFVQECHDRAIEYVTNGDGLCNYCEQGSWEYNEYEHCSADIKALFIKYEGLLGRDKVIEAMFDLSECAYFSRGFPHSLPSNCLVAHSYDEIEEQLSGLSGKVNGVDFNEAFEGLCNGLTADEIEDALSAFCIKGDLLYINMGYDMFGLTIDIEKVNDELAEKLADFKAELADDIAMFTDGREVDQKILVSLLKKASKFITG
jgi:hypothetical protein